MSHEGIRILRDDQARRAVEAERPLPKAATTPAKIQIALTEGTGMTIRWQDGHQSSWTFPFLRDACPCATCHEQREAEDREPGTPKPTPPQLLPIFTAPARPKSATPVGRYAIKFHWNDGHEAGIYSWDYLRRLDKTPA